jgi:hypothetical protein
VQEAILQCSQKLLQTFVLSVPFSFCPSQFRTDFNRAPLSIGHPLFSDKDAAALLGKLCTADTTSTFQALSLEQQQAVVELR